MANTKPVPVSRGLGTAGRRLWTGTHQRYGFATHEELILLEACRCADRLEQLSTELKAKGLTEQRRDRKLREARAQQLVMARLIASLRLPDDKSGRKPQRRNGFRGSYGISGAV